MFDCLRKGKGSKEKDEAPKLQCLKHTRYTLSHLAYKISTRFLRFAATRSRISQKPQGYRERERNMTEGGFGLSLSEGGGMSEWRPALQEPWSWMPGGEVFDVITL